MEHNLLQPPFRPTDQELITHFLAKKAADASFRSPFIREVYEVVKMGMYKCEPWDLPHRAPEATAEEEAKWYFFCKRRVGRTSTRWGTSRRTTASGYWEATSRSDEKIFSGFRPMSPCLIIGAKRTFVFYRAHGERTDWLMHEYRLLPGSNYYNHVDQISNAEKNIEWVICRVFRMNPTEKEAEEQPAAASSSSTSTSLWHELRALDD